MTPSAGSRDSGLVRFRLRHQPVQPEPQQLGWAHAQRLAEAIVIAANATGLLQVTGTAKLAELKALHESLSAGQPAQ
jgi:hypothetical protein